MSFYGAITVDKRFLRSAKAASSSIGVAVACKSCAGDGGSVGVCYALSALISVLTVTSGESRIRSRVGMHCSGSFLMDGMEKAANCISGQRRLAAL
jgi:hypothetical protein